MASGLVFRSIGVGLGLATLLAAPGCDPPDDEASRVSTTTTASPALAYVGREACARCHPAQHDMWRGSHHDLAMDVADEATVLGEFDHATYTYNGITSTFFRRGDRYVVRTDGPDGSLADYEIDYTFGVDPLQQYLVAFPGGRHQVLPLCWDTRPAEDGGQRWFHLYPDEAIDHEDPLHWTGRYQSWNSMCAECHSTDLRRNYDLAGDRYETTWKEIDVSCEACHGPGSRHVAWAQTREPGGAAADEDTGLAVTLADHDGGAWIHDLETGTARRTVPRTSNRQVEACARCHARRSPLTDEYVHGRPLLDTHRLALLTEPLYHADGQILDEVYVHGSFVQSRMYHAGVTCSDCHDPHGLELHAAGDASCTKCHLPAKFDSPDHHFHDPGTAGASCIECHMPQRTYMVVDPRRDHSFRVPRPDLSVALGTPNACTDCHSDRSASWAAAAVSEWYGPARRAEPHFGTALHAGRSGGPGAARALIDLVRDDEQPAIARATALALLPRPPSRDGLGAAAAALADVDPLVRAAALEALAPVDAEDRLRLALPLLDDPVRAVRDAAASNLASIPAAATTREASLRIDRAVDAYIDSQRAAAERPESHLNAGVIQTQRGRVADATASYRTAIRLDPGAAASYVNLADLFRSEGRDAEGERVLRGALAVVRDRSPVHHALGLALVRQGRAAEAIDELALAAALAPEVPRHAYVHAVALDSVGRRPEAIVRLEETLTRHPFDRDVLSALVSYHLADGRRTDARPYAQRLLELAPDDAELRRLVETLR